MSRMQLTNLERYQIYPGCFINSRELMRVVRKGCGTQAEESFAAKQGFVVESYRDEATGLMGKNAAMHPDAHEQCLIANSVNSEVRCVPVDASSVQN